MKILILTLTDQRDKEIDNFLAQELRRFGHEVYVHNYIYAARQSVPYLKPDIVVHPMVGSQYKLDFVKKCKEWGCLVVVRRGEAGASREMFKQMDRERKSIVLGNWNYEPFVDLELVWGPEFAAMLCEMCGVPREKIKACGAFAFDPYFRSECQRNRKHRKTVLFATAWSCADGKPDYCECGLPEDSSYHKVIYDNHRKGRDLWIDVIEKLHTQFLHEWEFVIKVRPGELPNEYQKKLGHIAKVLPQNYPSSQALRDADLLIHAGSTMAIEAHLLNIPSVNFHNTNPDGLLAKVCPRAETVGELVDVFRQVDVNETNVNWNVLHELEYRLYGQIDGKATLHAATYIDMLAEKHTGMVTEIPDAWPQEALYHEDKTNVHLESSRGDIKWLCPGCRNSFFARKKIRSAKCPYCGLPVEMRSPGKQVANSVAK